MLAGWLLNTTKQCCTAQSSFNRLVPQIFLPDFFVVERARDTARAASNSCQSRRIASTFDLRVSRKGDKQHRYQSTGKHRAKAAESVPVHPREFQQKVEEDISPPELRTHTTDIHGNSKDREHEVEEQ